MKMNIVTYDGSADGSTYLQTKVQLFDRTGSGWPDVVFASPTDVTWASAPTNPSAQAFAAPVDQLVSSSVFRASPPVPSRRARSAGTRTACATTSPRWLPGTTRS